MINSLVSGISGFNANAYTLPIARGNGMPDKVFAPKTGFQTQEYWTPERMREAVPPDMGRAVPQPDVKSHIPEQSELPEDGNTVSISGYEPNPKEYWTPERMRDTVPPDMGRAVPESEAKPHIPEQSKLPQEMNPGIVSGSVPQFDGYWTPDRMREAMPPDMGRAVPEPDVKPHIPERSESPEETNPISVSGSVSQIYEYWTPERMREAMPPDMGRAVPQPDVKPHIPEQNDIPAEAKPAGKPGSLPQFNPRPINIVA